MTLLYCPPCFLDHETGNHPERADRIRQTAGAAGGGRPVGPMPHARVSAGFAAAAGQGAFARLHRRGLGLCEIGRRLHRVRHGRQPGQLRRGPDGGRQRVRRGRAAVRGEDTQALCLVRPPGHHAMVNHAMGFCIFNNIAVAARLAVDVLGLDRVLIVDWDIHHGNGTQATFWEDPKVGFLSIHRWPFYPGTGDADETGGGRGLGTTLNLPVEYGTPRKDYLALFGDNLEKFAAKIKPQLVLLSAGFDAHRLDPVGDLGLETEDFIPLDQPGARRGRRLRRRPWSACSKAATTPSSSPTAWRCIWRKC